MAKKRRGRKMSGWRKGVKAAMGIIGKGLGITVALQPVLTAVPFIQQNPTKIGIAVLDAYTGYNPETNVFNSAKLMGSVASIVGSVVIFALFGFLARKV